jgi:anti-sigma B factor antagonist
VEITTQEYKRVGVLTASGRIDSATAAEFEAAARQLVSKGKVNLVFDLSGVDFLSSAGLRVLVTTRKEVKAAGGDLALANPSDRVKETLEVAGLDVLFERFPDRETAIGSF